MSRLAAAELERLWEADPLLPEYSPESFGLACRRTALSLLEGARRGMSKAELAAWLTGPYERLAAFDEDDAAPSAQGLAISPVRLDELLRTTHEEILLVLRELATPEGRAAFAHVAVSMGLVARTVDAAGAEALAPRAQPRMSLALRVMSLLAVDALVNPEAYERELVVCPRCAAAVFDAEARRYGACVIHASGVVIKP